MWPWNLVNSFFNSWHLQGFIPISVNSLCCHFFHLLLGISERRFLGETYPRRREFKNNASGGWRTEGKKGKLILFKPKEAPAFHYLPRVMGKGKKISAHVVPEQIWWMGRDGGHRSYHSESQVTIGQSLKGEALSLLEWMCFLVGSPPVQSSEAP